MIKLPIKSIALVFATIFAISSHGQQSSCKNKSKNQSTISVPGAYRIDNYLSLLANKKVGIVANHTSLIKDTHLVDTLLSRGVNIIKIFGPEHGFRGDQPDGKEITNTIDQKTGIEIVSLYGNHRKPTKSDLSNIDIMIFDIQDVGVRFYTYISTLTYVMETCAQNNIPLLILDRPNPNGYYVDGPILRPEFSSFVGLHPIPIVYGMTIGEYASMVNNEKWLEAGVQCSIHIIKCDNYTHTSRYQLPVSPSPNLQNMDAIYLYPSLCLFEGTVVSVGRGTDKPFTVFGHPKLTSGSYTFTPKPIKGVSENPPLKGQLCKGQELTKNAKTIKNKGKIELSWLIESYKMLRSDSEFFTPYFNKLAGNSLLQDQITKVKTESEIRSSWHNDLIKFKKLRKQYLLYPDFE